MRFFHPRAVIPITLTLLLSACLSAPPLTSSELILSFSEAGKEIGRDGHFVAYSKGVVVDMRSGLMWAARDNGSRILYWDEAKSYCENYRGAGHTDWRMPDVNELAGLYDNSKSYQAKQRKYNVHLTELIQLSSCCLWTSETLGPAAAIFDFKDGGAFWISQGFAHFVLPVRYYDRAARIVEQGNRDLKMGDFRMAIDRFNQLFLYLDKSPCSNYSCLNSINSAFVGRGIAYFESGLYTKAIDDFSAVIERIGDVLDDNRAQIYRLRGQSYFHRIVQRNNAGGAPLTNISQLNIDNPENKSDQEYGCADMVKACKIIDRCPQGYLNFFCSENPIGGYPGAPAFFIINIPTNK